MAAQVSEEQRELVRKALSEAGVNQETVGAFKDGDLNVLYTNGWDTKAFLLMARQDLLLARGLSPGAVGVIMNLQQGEPTFLICFCSWESCHAWGIVLTSQRDLDTIKRESHAYAFIIELSHHPCLCFCLS